MRRRNSRLRSQWFAFSYGKSSISCLFVSAISLSLTTIANTTRLYPALCMKTIVTVIPGACLLRFRSFSFNFAHNQPSERQRIGAHRSTQENKTSSTVSSFKPRLCSCASVGKTSSSQTDSKSCLLYFHFRNRRCDCYRHFCCRGQPDLLHWHDLSQTVSDLSQTVSGLSQTVSDLSQTVSGLSQMECDLLETACTPGGMKTYTLKLLHS